jgi:hypothetical protein
VEVINSMKLLACAAIAGLTVPVFAGWRGNAIAILNSELSEFNDPIIELRRVEKVLAKEGLDPAALVISGDNAYFEVNAPIPGGLKRNLGDEGIELVSTVAANFRVKGDGKFRRYSSIADLPEGAFDKPTVKSHASRRSHTRDIIVKIRGRYRKDEATAKASRQKVDAAATSMGLDLSVNREQTPASGVQFYHVRAPNDFDKAIDEIAKLSEVEFVQPNYEYNLAASPNDYFFANSYQKSLNAINMPAAWDVIKDAGWVKVAVLDSGINYTHWDLSQNMWSNPNAGSIYVYPGLNSGLEGSCGINLARFENNDPYASNDPQDNFIYSQNFRAEVNHGTRVAGIIGAVTNNTNGIAGIAWKVQLMAIKIAGNNKRKASSLTIAAGLRYAKDRNANVINLSIEDPRALAEIESPDSLVFSELVAVKNANIPVVVASGNQTVDLDASPLYPACYNLRNMITVGGCDTTSNNSEYSTGKHSVDVFAPSSDIYSTSYAVQGQGSIEYSSGTSFASAHVAGLVALLKAKYPAESPERLLARVRNSCTPRSALTGKGISGGIVNASEALNTDATLRAISSRAYVKTGNDATFMGFVISGANTPKRVCIRAIGPTLAPLGIPSGVTLPNPKLTLIQSINGQNVTIASNASVDTLNSADKQFVNHYWKKADGTPLSLTPAEAGLVVSLSDGIYNAVIEPENGVFGTGLVELYDEGAPDSGRLVAVSTRAYHGTASYQDLVVGISSHTGVGRKAVIARALGPGLGLFNVANTLPDPLLKVFFTNNTSGIADGQNNNWKDNGSAFMRRATSVGFPGYSDLDSGLMLMVPSGGATFNLQSLTGAGGVVLVDVIEF